MNLENLETLRSTSKFEGIGTLLVTVKTSAVRVLDWFSPNLKPIPLDTYSSEVNFRGGFITQADHDKLWDRVKDVKFNEN